MTSSFLASATFSSTSKSREPHGAPERARGGRETPEEGDDHDDARVQSRLVMPRYYDVLSYDAARVRATSRFARARMISHHAFVVHAARARRRGGRPEHTLVAEAGVFAGSVSQSAASAASNARRIRAASSRQSRATSGMIYARRSVAPCPTEEPGRETPSQTVRLRGFASSEVR